MLIISHSKPTTIFYLCFRKAVAFIHSTFSGVDNLAHYLRLKGLTLVRPFNFSDLSTSKPDRSKFPTAGFSVFQKFRDCIRPKQQTLVGLSYRLCSNTTH